MRILLVVYDNDAYIHVFPLGLAYIAAILENEGYDVEIYKQDKFYYPLAVEETKRLYLQKNANFRGFRHT